MSWFSDALDRAIEIVSPQRALERKAARAAAEQFGEYKGARQTRLTHNWDISSGSADYDLLPDPVPSSRITFWNRIGTAQTAGESLFEGVYDWLPARSADDGRTLDEDGRGNMLRRGCTHSENAGVGGSNPPLATFRDLCPARLYGSAGFSISRFLSFN